MYEYLTLIERLSELKNGNAVLYLNVLLVINTIVSIIDFSLGWLNAKFNKKVNFISGVALHGIIKKSGYITMLTLFMFIAFLVLPKELAIASLTVLYLGYMWSELNSVLSHLGLTKDGKKGSLFIDFVKQLKGDM